MEIKIKKGLDLPLAGAVPAEAKAPVAVDCKRAAVVPDDFPGFIAKVDVREGDVVAAGQPHGHEQSGDDQHKGQHESQHYGLPAQGCGTYDHDLLSNPVSRVLPIVHINQLLLLL